MNNLHQWAVKHNISMDAINDLRCIMGVINNDPKLKEGVSEAAIQTHIRLEASRKGSLLMRNNVGVLMNNDGVPVRYGLANDSKAVNKRMKSSDLIGLQPVHIQPFHVGQVIGQFVARECKHGSWRYRATEEEQAQLKFLELVMSMGGDAAFAIGEGTL